MPPFSRHCSVTFGLDNAAASFGARITMAYQTNTNGDLSSSLRAANIMAKPAASHVAAGPFGAALAKDENETTLSDALITGMLVVYPVVATVVAVIVGLALSGPVT
jgi:hypothetical protein